MLDPVGYGVCGSYHLLEYSRCRPKGAHSNNFNPPEESQRSKYGLGLKVGIDQIVPIEVGRDVVELWVVRPRTRVEGGAILVAASPRRDLL
jgi:hypothetical protein